MLTCYQRVQYLAKGHASPLYRLHKGIPTKTLRLESYYKSSMCCHHLMMPSPTWVRSPRLLGSPRIATRQHPLLTLGVCLPKSPSLTRTKKLDAQAACLGAQVSCLGVCHTTNFWLTCAAPRNSLGQPSQCPMSHKTQDLQGSPQLVFY